MRTPGGNAGDFVSSIVMISVVMVVSCLIHLCHV